ncbi:MAG TPA: PKD domain-containing protein [Gemmatimonadaceae bacterium]|nr:PKD domain-containing protein [Gemmatimonadaceae bacterium]
MSASRQFSDGPDAIGAARRIAKGPASIGARARFATLATLLAVGSAVACSDSPSEPKVEPRPNDNRPVALDSFTRASSSGWGEAQIGGRWVYRTTDPSMFRVDGSSGRIVVPVTTPQVALLENVRSKSGSGLVAFSIGQAPDNPNRFHTVEVYARRHAAGGDENYYRYSVRAFGTGQIDLRIEKRVNGVNTFVSEPFTISPTWQAGARYWIRWDCVGTSPTTVIRMKVWQDGSSEPGTWQLTTASDEPALDAEGTIGFRVAPPSADQVTFPVEFSFDDLALKLPVVNPTRPVARYTAPTSGQTSVPLTFDATASSDAGGDLPLAYHWDFGDGSAGSGPTATHTYTSVGAFQVRLTVIDAGGAASDPLVTTVNIAPGDPNLLVSDSFTRSHTGRWGTADAGGVWRRSSTPGIFDVNGTRGLITAAPGSAHNIVASFGYGVNVTGLMSFGVDAAPDSATRFHTVEAYARRNDHVGDGEDFYRYRVRLFGGGKVDLRILQSASAVEAWLTDNTPVTMQWQAGKNYWLRWEAVGTSPSTTLSMKVWAEGTEEPAAWQLTTTVNEPRLDAAGTTGVRVEASPWSGTKQATFTFDDLVYSLKQ